MSESISVTSPVRSYGERESKRHAIEAANRVLATKNAEQRVSWALENLPGESVMSSSFGAHAAVMLHLLTRQRTDIPIILIDTGYLFAETYRFVDQLSERLDLNLKIYRSLLSPAWQEARHGQRWRKGARELAAYNKENKVEPMERALVDLNAKTWFAGLRRDQADSRRHLSVLQGAGERWKVHPIIDWSDRDVYRYLQRHALPYHPLWEKGYVSIGDVHTTRSLAEVTNVDEVRFFGLKRECGIHEIDLAALDH